MSFRPRGSLKQQFIVRLNEHVHIYSIFLAFWKRMLEYGFFFFLPWTSICFVDIFEVQKRPSALSLNYYWGTINFFGSLLLGNGSTSLGIDGISRIWITAIKVGSSVGLGIMRIEMLLPQTPPWTQLGIGIHHCLKGLCDL